MKRNEAQIHPVARMNLENIMLSERSHSQKINVILFLLYEKSTVNTDAETENRLIITRAAGEKNGK